MPPTYNHTSKYNLPSITGTSLVSDIDTGEQTLAQALDTIIATDGQGLAAARPVSTPVTPGKSGRWFKSTDGGLLFRDNGQGYDQVVLSDEADLAAGVASRRTLGTGAQQAAAGNDSRFGAGGPPSGAAGGDLSGTYPNPLIGNGKVVLATLASAIAEALVPVGSILATGRATAPTGYALCDGSTLSRTTYATLFAAIGILYGPGDGVSTFTLPDLRGRVPVGVDGAAARLTANDALGNSSGEEKHTLTTGELPAHSHTQSGMGTMFSTPQVPNPGAGSGTNRYMGADPGATNTANAGGGGAHNVMQPFQIVNFLIKT